MYKGRLRGNGQTVAVKVQRPGVREQIAMDVYILRNLLAVIREWRKVNRWAAWSSSVQRVEGLSLSIVLLFAFTLC